MAEKRLICQFCGKELKNPGARGIHEKKCSLNPNVFIPQAYNCQFCGQECLGKDGLSNHEKHCLLNPERIKRKNYRGKSDTDSTTIQECKYCHIILPNRKLYWQHNKVCEERLKLPLDSLGRVINYDGIKKAHATLRARYTSGELTGTFIGKHHTQETKDKMSNATKQFLSDMGYSGGARYSVKACEFIDKLNKENGWHLQHGMNGGEITVGPYYLDGYDKELNIAFEYDEKHHYMSNGELKSHDIEKQQYIKEILHCTFYRYDESKDLLYEV